MVTSFIFSKTTKFCSGLCLIIDFLTRCLETTLENLAPSPHPPLYLCFALVMYLVRQIDHPQTSKEVWRSVVSIQRKRAVIACFRQTSLHMMPRYLGIRGQQKIQDPACAASASCSFSPAPFLFLNLHIHIKVLTLSHIFKLLLRVMSMEFFKMRKLLFFDSLCLKWRQEEKAADEMQWLLCVLSCMGSFFFEWFSHPVLHPCWIVSRT